MSSIKKPRQKNFTEGEKDVLLDIVVEHKAVLECQQTNKKSNASKATAWQTIMENYNSQVVEKRSVEALKVLYNNLKADTKKIVARKKVNILN